MEVMPPLHSTPVGAVLPGAGSARGPHRCSAGVIFSPSLPCSHIAHRGTGTVHSRPTQDIRARAWLITIRSRVFRPLLGPTHCVTMYLGLAPVCSSPSFSASSRLPPAAPLKNSISSRRPHRPADQNGFSQYEHPPRLGATHRSRPTTLRGLRRSSCCRVVAPFIATFMHLPSPLRRPRDVSFRPQAPLLFLQEDSGGGHHCATEAHNRLDSVPVRSYQKSDALPVPALAVNTTTTSSP